MARRHQNLEVGGDEKLEIYFMLPKVCSTICTILIFSVLLCVWFTLVHSVWSMGLF